jgi:hypothetical protein
MINIIKKENLVEVVSWQSFGAERVEKAHKFAYSEVSVSLYRGFPNDVVEIMIGGSVAYKVKLSDITIQRGDEAPVQATPDNWDELTDDLVKSKGGAGGDGMKQSVYDSTANGIVDDSERLGGVEASGYVREVPEPVLVSDNIEATNVTGGDWRAIGIGSDGKTYFCCFSGGIKVLNDATGAIENTNITSDSCRAIGIASNGKTYFGFETTGIKVLNDATGAIENTNITSGYYFAIGIASNGKTYFCGSGINFLNLVYTDGQFIRKFGAWVPAEDVPNDSYSMEEVKTPDTWIDGKPIYKKTYIKTGALAAGDNVLGSMSDMDILVDAKGMVVNDAGDSLIWQDVTVGVRGMTSVVLSSPDAQSDVVEVRVTLYYTKA